MATTKKPAAKKTAAKTSSAKATVTKNTTATKSTPKKAVTKKSPVSTKSTKATPKTGYKSFKVSQNASPFTSFRVTRQTFYWIILVAFIIFVQLWILKLHIEVAALLEQQQIELRDSI